MRLKQIKLSDFKGIKAEMAFAPAMVFFGPNDAGKSNLLEAIELALGGSETVVRRDPVISTRGSGFSSGEDDDVSMTAVVELEGIDVDGHPDRDFLREGLLEWISWPVSEWPEEEDHVGWVLRDAPEEALSGEAKTNLDAVRATVAALMLKWVEERCSDWERAGNDFTEVLSACLESKLVRLDYEGATLLLPDPNGWRDSLRKACTRLTRCRPLFPERRVPFLDPILGLTPSESDLLNFGSDDHTAYVGFSGYASFVRAATAEEDADLPRRIEDFIEKRSHVHAIPMRNSTGGTRLVLPIPSPADDGWFIRRDELEGVNPRVSDTCRELADEANRVAPKFVSTEHEIVVQPLLGSERAAFGGAKVQIALRSRHTGRTIDLSLGGSGIRTWARYSLREAIRTLVRSSKQKDDRDKLVIYVLDEPERHLHPAAQEEVAAWIAERVRSGATAIIATHSLPFLDLPYTGAEYYRVYRDEDGLTKTRRLTADPIGILDRSVKQAGLSNRAQLVQLTRAVLLVEGEHDKIVVNHLFGRDLRSARVGILPLRGAKNASVVEFYRNLDIPVFILFDNTNARSLSNPDDLRSDTMEEREIKVLLREWPGDRVKPTVLPYSDPDIICALPPEAVRTVMHQQKSRQNFTDWKALVADYRKLPPRERREFKDFAATKTGLVFDGHMIRKLLNASPSKLASESPLYAPMQQLLASVGE